ncbi:MAG: DNA polymerase [Sphaerochaetaceae bacterium]|nr:DNA polymerase [Sphaerochaetaceae bacterium]
MAPVVPNQRRRNQLKALSRQPRAYPILAYDVETDSDGNFTYAHVYGERYYRKKVNRKVVTATELVDIGCETSEALQDAILGRRDPKIRVPCTLVAYNYKYDYPYILPITDDKKVLWGSGGFISGRLINGAYMIDLTNHTQKRSLEEIIEIMGIKDIKKYPLHADPYQRQQRCRDDARATYELGRILQDFYIEHWDVGLEPTIAGQAMKIFRSRFLDYNFYREGAACSLNTIERDAYYGGRTECFRRGVYTVHSLDVKSMYPSVMVGDRIPDPNSAIMMENGAVYREYFDADEAGLYHVRIFVPKGTVGLLPHRSKEGRLLFPWGILEGWYVKEELQAAEQYGAHIIKCFAFIRYTRRIDLFTGYIMEMFNRRKEYAGGTLQNMMFKILMNSLYGKFGQKNPVGGFTGKIDDYEGDLEGARPVVQCVVMGEPCVNLAAQYYEEAYGAFPIVAAYITAVARVKLLHKLMEHRDTIVYCDTDSAKYLASEEQDASGSEIGQWEYEYTKSQIFIRPKLYYDQSLTALKMKGVKMGKYPPLVWSRLPTYAEDEMLIDHIDNKGVAVRIPLAQVTVIAMMPTGIKARFYKPTGIKEGITRDLAVNRWSRHEKTLQWDDAKRVWDEAPEIQGAAILSSASVPPYVGIPYNERFLRRYHKSHLSHTVRNTAWGQIGDAGRIPEQSSSPQPAPDQSPAPQSLPPEQPDTAPVAAPPAGCIRKGNRGSAGCGYRHSGAADWSDKCPPPASEIAA